VRKKEVKDLSMKEMPIEEKYNQIFNFMIFENAMSYAYHNEQGTLNKWLDYTLEAYRGYMGPMLEMMKNLPTKQVVDQMINMQQMMQSLSEIEVSWISDNEAVMRFKNCEILRRSRDIVKMAGLNIDPKFFCEIDLYRHVHPRHFSKDFGMEMACELEENGCKWTFKLK
jgi:hypothetical protein